MGNEKLGLSFAGWMWALKREKEAEYYKVNYCDEVKFTYDIGGSIVRSFFQDYENSPELLEIAYTCLFTNWPWVTHSIGNRDNDKLNINFNDEKVIKVVGVVTTLAGLGLSIAENVLADKAMDRKINKKISEQLSKRNGHGYSKR